MNNNTCRNCGAVNSYEEKMDKTINNLKKEQAR